MRKIVWGGIMLILVCNVSQASDIFANPNENCSLLRSEGLATEGWKPSRAFANEWFCMTTLIPFGATGANGMANNIAFYVNGTSRYRADDIRLKININNPRERSRAFARLTGSTKALFSALGESVPPELSDALEAQKPVALTTEYGKVELILEPGRIDSYKVVLTDARFLAAKETQRNASASDFDRCKQVVAAKVGYPESILSGDGDPVQESGYKSFMLKGRNKDLFFCEVHSGGRYKIKAALGGKFPFKYIDQGAFE